MNGCLKLVACDEVHMHVQHARFQQAFLHLKAKLFQPLKNVGHAIRYLAMTATFTEDYVQKLEKMWGIKFTEQIWATPEEMSKRGLGISLMPRSPSASTMQMKKIANRFFKEHEQRKWGKVVIYCNRKCDVEALVKHTHDTFWTSFGPHSDKFVVSVYGQGMKLEDKALNIGLFCNAIDHPLSERTLVLVATAGSANAGIDCPTVGLILRKGMPPSLFDLYQELGRLARSPGNEDEDANMVIYPCIEDFQYLLWRYKDDKDGASELLEVLDLMVIHRGCWHRKMEDTFGKQGVENTLPDRCDGNCPVCSGERATLEPKVSKAGLQKVLDTLLEGGSVSLLAFVDKIHKNNVNVKSIFGVLKIAKFLTDFFVMQLVSSGLIECIYKPMKEDHEVHVKLARGPGSGDIAVYKDDAKWSKFRPE
jgi:superfamily II DNA helicase RecQ